MRLSEPWISAGITIGLFALAVAVRWWALPDHTREMWGDEAQFMLFARNLIQGVTRRASWPECIEALKADRGSSSRTLRASNH